MAVVQQHLLNRGTEEFYIAFHGSQSVNPTGGASNYPWTNAYGSGFTSFIGDIYVGDDESLYYMGYCDSFCGGWQSQWYQDGSGNNKTPYGGHVAKVNKNGEIVYQKWQENSNIGNITAVSYTHLTLPTILLV